MCDALKKNALLLFDRSCIFKIDLLYSVSKGGIHCNLCSILSKLFLEALQPIYCFLFIRLSGFILGFGRNCVAT